ILSTTVFAIRSRTSITALPRCGVSTTFFIFNRAGGTFGSFSNTSSPAPAMRFFFSARTSAASSMTAPRAVLMMKAVGFINANSRSEIICRQQLIERHVLDLQFALELRLAVRAPINHPHAEAAGAARGRLADTADRDQADGLAMHEAADRVVRLRSGEAAGAHRAVALDHPPRHRDHQP